MKIRNEVLIFAVVMFIFGALGQTLEVIYKTIMQAIKGQSTVVYANLFVIFMYGLPGALIGLLNEFRHWSIDRRLQALIGVAIALVSEYVFGIIFNPTYLYWDYRREFLNFQGQICLTYAVLWYFLIFWAIKAEDKLRDIIKGIA